MLDFLRVFIGILSIIAINLPTDLDVIIPWIFRGTAVALVMAVMYKLSKVKTPFVHKKLVFFDTACSLIMMKDFCRIWMASSKIAIIAARLHLSLSAFLLISSVILGCFSASIIDLIVSAIIFVWEWIKERKKTLVFNTLEHAFLVMGIVVVETFQINYSTLCSYESLRRHNILYIIISIVIVLLVNIILYSLIQKWRLSLTINAVVFSLWSVINYYVVLYHGNPFYFSEFKNTMTAATVMSEYSYPLNLVVITIIVLFLVEVSLTLALAKYDRKTNYIKTFFIYAMVSLGLFIFLFQFRSILIPKNVDTKTWNQNEKKYGFLICNIRDYTGSSQQFICPDGYDRDNLLYDSLEIKETKGVYPDIILIVNETFCDLDFYSDVQTDTDYLASFYGIDSAYYGYVVTPNIGGGTNNTEFELLSSKSMYLVTNTAPFTWMSSTLESRSIVEYLKDLGYYTTGMHCATAANYNRDRAYPAVGFDNILLGHDAFRYISYNGERSWLDSDNYKDLIDQYNSHLEKGPQLIYLLTLQNHGGFEKNDASLDTVHTTKNFGNLTDDINEFLSSIKLSADAFRDLTDYYASVDRPVIICMVGDHAPSFVKTLPGNDRHMDIDSEISMRMVPYVMWSNYGVNFDTRSEYLSMVDVIPVLLKSASLPMSPFYQTIYKLHEDIPVRTSNGLYIDKNGNMGSYQIGDNWYDKLNMYYCLEYNSLENENDYKKELFISGK